MVSCACDITLHGILVDLNPKPLYFQDITYQSFWTLTANPHVIAHKSVQEAALAADVTAQQVGVMKALD